MVSAQIGPRLGALLSDLGIPHAANPEPSPREHWPQAATIPTGRTRVEVTLRVDDADLDALVGAGLTRPVVFLTSVNGTIRPDEVPALAEVPGVLSIELTTTKRPTIHSSVPATKADYFRTSNPQRTGAGVVVGVVDSGIDIFHHAFRTDSGDTRITALWDMTSPYTLTALGTPTGGTFRIEWVAPGTTAPETTPALPHNVTAAAIQAALEAFASINPGDVVVTGGPLPGTPIVVSFAGRYRRRDVEPLDVNSATTPIGDDIIVERGRRYDFAAINAAVRQPEDQWGSWDEDGHGTHVAGIAAGDGSQSGTAEEGGMCHGSGYYIGVAPGADLVIVKTTFTAAANKEAVQWIFTEAGARPAVVNLSYGSEESAHDGSEEEEVEYAALLQLHPERRAIVTVAGNSGGRADVTDPSSPEDGGMHAFKPIAANGTMTMRFVVADDDTDDDWLYLWYGGASRISLRLEAPGGGAPAGPVNPGDPVYTTPLDGHGLHITNHTNASTTGRHSITVRISPRTAGTQTIRPGTWTIHLSESAGTGADVDCWIKLESDDQNPRFVNDDQDRTRTIDSPGAGHSVITVGEYDHRDNTLAESSGRGPTVDTRPLDERKPDLAAPGTGIVAAKSRARNTGWCSDCCYDFYVSESGSSMAAPHVTGVVALMFEADHTLTWSQVRTRLRDGADPPDPITGPTLPNTDWGAGILNAKKALQIPDVTNAVTPAPVASSAFAGSRLDELRALVLATPAGQLVAALVSTHIDEVARLVNTCRRVTVAWHRMGGPAMLNRLAHSVPGSPVVVPTVVDGRDVRDGLVRLLDALESAGSLPLRADIRRHRDLLLTLPGLDLARLDRLDRVDLAG